MTHSISPPTHAESENRHVEGIAETPQLHEFLLRDRQIVPKPGEMLLHHMKRKRVMSRRNRSMCCEEAGGSDLFCRFFEGLALLNKLAGALQQHECGVSFVRMEYRRLNS